VEHFSKVAAQAGGGEIGHLSVGVPGGVNPVLVETLRLLGKKYPGLRIELQYMSTGLQLEALRDGRIDIGFLYLPVNEPTLALEIISREPLWIALPKGHRLTRYKRVPFSAIAEEKVILFPRRVTPGFHDAITGMARNEGFMLNVAHEVDSILGGLTLVSANLGIAFCTPGARPLWPNLAFRPVQGPTFIEQAVGYHRNAKSPVLETFLRAVRQTNRRGKGKPQ
jgi:DNA-binding transcriptional LysR family regulator